jgi:hypothetical protein
MMFLGLFILRNRKGKTLFSSEEFRSFFAEPEQFSNIRKLALVVTCLALFNFVVVMSSAYNGFQYSESVQFCAELCHVVMAPEHTAYRGSPHSRIECVECHIGDGASWFVKSKLSGVRQLFAVALDTYSRPIQTPLHGLRPAHETCEECHRPELIHGDRLRVKNRFLADEENSQVRTVLLMRVGAGDFHGQKGHGSHWHVSDRKQVLYKYADRKRLKITEVRLTDDDGKGPVYRADRPVDAAAQAGNGGERVMDCLDCHNRPTHVYSSPEDALDLRLLSGEIPRTIPYIKKQAMELISEDYASQAAGIDAISTRLRAWYSENYPEFTDREPELLEQAIRGVTRAYTENVFPHMKVGFGTYEKHLGHADGKGCFRCHDEAHVTSDGRTISQECDLCHRILTEEQPVNAAAFAGDEAAHDTTAILRAGAIR